MKRLNWLYLGSICCTLPHLAYSYETNTHIVRQKLARPETNFKASLNGGANAAFNLPQQRPITLRDSGRTQSLMFIHNVLFRYLGNVGFYIPQLSITLTPNNPTSPVMLDDPTSFALHIHQGSIVLSSSELDSLLNKEVFSVPDTVIRNVRTETTPGRLVLNGEMYRGKWIPFVMKGGITVKDNHYLYFTPDTVFVDGVDTSKVLTVANVKLDELLKIDLPGVKLIGSTIILDTEKLFPPPRLYMKVTSAKLDEKGLALEFNDGHSPKTAKPLVPASSYMIVKGGDVKIMRAIPLNISLQINNDNPDKQLHFCLYRYRDQVVQGSMSLNRDGDILALFPNISCSY